MRILRIALLPIMLAVGTAQAQTLDGLLKGVLGGKSASGGGTSSALGNDQLIEGLKEALRVGTETVVGQLGAPDGFNADPQVRVPLPKTLDDAKGLLSRVGLSGTLDDLELRMNRAAEQATPKAQQLFYDAITSMTLDDAKKIYDGPDDAATRYFQGRMTPDLRTAMRPIVDETLAEVGAVKVYNQVVGRAQSLPFAPNVNLDLTGHVLDEALEGLFLYIAREEAAIRNQPAKRVTEILQRTFGSN